MARRDRLRATLTAISILAPVTVSAPTMAVAQETVAATAPKSAAEPSANTIETLVVTARRINENIQDVPISIAAFSGEALERKNITSVLSLNAYIPGLQVIPYASSTTLIVGI